MSSFPVAPSEGTSGVGESSFDVSPNLQPLSDKELAAVGYLGGFTNTSTLAEWMHVVHAESGGSPGAVGVGGGPGGAGSDTEYSMGLSQVNVAASPDLAPGILTPTTNALAAHAILQSQGWGAWAPRDFASAPSQSDVTAAAQVASMSGTARKNLASEADLQALSAISYSLPPYPGTSEYPPALTPSYWPNASIPSGPPGQQALVIALLGNTPGEKPGTIPASPPTSLPGAVTNRNLPGLGALLQQFDLLLNPTKKVTTGGILDINITSLEMMGVRVLVALPGVIGLLMAAASGLLGIAAGGGAQKVLSVIPGGKIAATAAKG